VRQSGENRLSLVPIGQQRMCTRKAPIDAEPRVVPQNPTIMFARIIAIDAVLNGGIRLDRAKAMGKSFGHEEPLSRLRGQHRSTISAVIWRTPADIDGDVEYCA
jgi:hypothetical protein